MKNSPFESLAFRASLVCLLLAGAVATRAQTTGTQAQAQRPAMTRPSPEEEQVLLPLGGRYSAAGIDSTYAAIWTLSGPKVTDQTLEKLAGLPIEGLVLNKTAVTPDGVAALAKLPKLRSLHFRGSVVGKGLAALASLDRLESLEIQSGVVGKRIGTRNPKQDLSTVGRLKHLKTLCFGGGLNDQEAEAIGQLTGLETLIIDSADLDETGWAKLGTLTGLRSLYLDFSNAGDAELEFLKAMPELRELSLRRNDNPPNRGKLSNACLPTIAELPHLENLDLSGTKIDDAGLNALAGARSLKHLSIDNTSIQGDGLSALSETQLQGLTMDMFQLSHCHEAFRHLPHLRGLALDIGPLDLDFPPVSVPPWMKEFPNVVYGPTGG
jgi:hypothetical protein